MSPEVLTALLALALVAVAAACVLAWRLRRELRDIDPDLERAEAEAAEQSRRVAALESLQGVQRAAEGVIETGTSVVREVHRGIASIPFGILETLPGTSGPTKVVRGVHDAISDGVYGALSGLNKAVGRELRRGLDAKASASSPQDGEPKTGPAPPEKPARED
ncbi:MAG: hypothetical protein NVS9B10_06590 [Nevskia sp.]